MDIQITPFAIFELAPTPEHQALLESCESLDEYFMAGQALTLALQDAAVWGRGKVLVEDDKITHIPYR